MSFWFFKEGLLQVWKSSKGTAQSVTLPRIAPLVRGFATTAVSQDTNHLPVLLRERSPRSSVILVEVSVISRNCGRPGHIARTCPNGALAAGFASRAPPPGRALNTSTLPPVKCYRCGGPNHMARDCLAAPGSATVDTVVAANVANKNKTCYKCQQEGHKQTLEKCTPVTTVMEAELTVGFLAFTESYVSRVTCKPYESVEAVASTSTPLFKTLSTVWRFQPSNTGSSSPLASHNTVRTEGKGTESTLVTLDLKYAFANPLHASVSSTFFGQVSKLMVKAFEDRCMEVYGRRT
ncbi:hypothetical protein H0H92_000883 [Tricholoma furcatifolium]|nr:hypothetical protein H0H92_000883 [Tricholoma furcatifolium]